MSKERAHEHPLHDQIPESAGVPASVRLLIGGSLFLVMMQGIFTVLAADFGRYPSPEAATKIPLK
jgi:hypothetical protein